MLATHVFSEFQSNHGYLRARACWCIQNFSDIHYSSEESLRFVLEQVLQVEAAIALQQLIKSQALGKPPVCLIVQLSISLFNSSKLH